jgi:hypothetical protein
MGGGGGGKPSTGGGALAAVFRFEIFAFVNKSGASYDVDG